MKTIAVFFDFSDASKHAVLYAVRLAKKLKAQIHLYNLCPVLAGGTQKFQKAMIHGYSEDEEMSLHAPFDAYAAELMATLADQSPHGGIHVSYKETIGDLSELMSIILNDRETCMLVTAPFGEQNLADFILGENCRCILDWSNIPLLVIPETAAIRNVEKIAFCTSLAIGDASYLNSLSQLLEPFSAEIMATHLNSPVVCESKVMAEISFREAIAERVEYGRVYYRDIPFNQCGRGWVWLKVNKPCDMLAIIQQPQSVMKSFFDRERSAHITHHITIPLLILPETH